LPLNHREFCLKAKDSEVPIFNHAKSYFEDRYAKIYNRSKYKKMAKKIILFQEDKNAAQNISKMERNNISIITHNLRISDENFNFLCNDKNKVIKSVIQCGEYL